MTTPETLRDLGTASLSDALDRLGLPGSAEGIVSQVPGARFAGPAFTVRYVPVGASRGTVGDYLDECVPGQVIVLDNGGRTDCTVWGDILTSIAHLRGMSGTVIHGVCRDVRRTLELGYPTFTRGRFMRTGKDRVEAIGTGCVVSLGQVQVRANDLMVGDDDGVVVIPAERVPEVAGIAAEIAAAEENIRRACLDGMSLAEARAAYGYHGLQRRPPMTSPAITHGSYTQDGKGA